MFPPPSTITLCLNSPHLELNHAPGVQLARFNTIVYFILVSPAQVEIVIKKSAFFLSYLGVSSVVLQKQIKELHQEQKVLRDTGWVFVC